MKCPKCRSDEKCKNGFVKSIQRYRCKSCGCSYTKSTTFRLPREVQEKAIQLYREGLGFRSIGRALGISNVTVMRWVDKLGARIQGAKKQENTPVSVMDIDEMRRFVQKKLKNSGSGLRMTVTEDKFTPCNLVIVTEMLAESCTGK